MLCVVNVQHNCAAHGCDDQGQEIVLEEREKSNQTKAKIRHFVPTDIMLNTAQMRDAIHVQRFRICASAIDRENAILQGAASEVAVRKQKEMTSKGKKKGLGALTGRAFVQ